MDKHNYLGNADISSISEAYESFLTDPSHVDESWQKFFEGFEFARKHFESSDENHESVDLEFRVISMIDWYRKRGHLFTLTNPVRTRRKYYPNLDIENSGLSKSDLDTKFRAGKEIGIGQTSLRKIEAHLKETYCRSVGAEYMFIRNPVILEWLQKRMEGSQNRSIFTKDEKRHIYNHLNIAVGFEKFIHTKFVGQKRFSLEGAEALIPALDWVIEKGSELGLREFAIGMAHRGRLNVLANIMNKPYSDIFKEFLATDFEAGIGLGDVKYHLGYDGNISTDSGHQVSVHLLPNPSHLEAVGPVVEGLARAKIDTMWSGEETRVAPIIIHGDAAIAAQGVVYELIQMATLPAYRTGGTIHLVINNQVGFTTNYLEGRSSTYCTDIAKVTKAPVFHVNGDDVEALIYTVTLAMEFRQKFHQDVFIDILCYRKYGHNEGDEPRFTQPSLYKSIARHKNVRDLYAEKLISDQVFTQKDIDLINNDFESTLEQEFSKCHAEEIASIQPFLQVEWKKFKHPVTEDFKKTIETGLDLTKLKLLADRINFLPDELLFFQKVHRIVDARKEAVAKNKLDWALGELLAYASLLDQGIKVRLSGQDSERGTFAHRHAALVQEDTGEKYYPLKMLSENQGEFNIYNSHLSEYGVLGFEYGYSMTTPHSLTIWEAQFGDFINTAQVIIDQFISSGEEKWGVSNGLVLLLPHGFEGQGPEHSSGRMERFLALCARNNMQVANPTTPANMFHLLRRQVLRDFRVPLIIFTPKSLLRHPACTSSMEELSSGNFLELIDDPETDPEKVSRVVFTTGKLYYELLKEKEKLNARDVALIRIEQIYPFPEDAFNKIISKYDKAIIHLWVQEEPENMGAWPFIRNRIKEPQLLPVCRAASGSPAVGLNKIHLLGQRELIKKVFSPCTCDLQLSYCGLQCHKGKSRLEILKQFEYLPIQK
ncbi:MAG: 2-oxoglutarate dehydrogenase E1 component [Bacteroidetes bacterium]|jgi:2-oxoglutarate dehydrogenase E1 component|nr:2-oxoglutarate dehydrogenase E1 component [Bacteroidota bacterium]MBT4401727.1 2-oxoglutarate dehydrogenase E1 component [Bacteroidota bacterium]MBT4409173.1 2-oxoglutarate dehydrogenase E1 component [Bacteroidota bacterium]MBT7094270.1 2-oxoglutarate dehydrogenase E1 component [Bacteroidota bacterium]MBT7462911.1 2-oxoglutarate dehydrogenase E1 component [Bacteroidota bacterium]